MEERRLSGFIIIGTGIRFLVDINPGAPLDGKGNVLDNLMRFLDACDLHGLHVTKRLANTEFAPVTQAIMASQSDAKRLADLKGSLQPEHAVMFREAANRVRQTLIAESKGIFVQVVREKRYSVEKLQKDVASLMAPGVFDRLPEIARYDFGEAGRCIAYEVPTAAAFHLMRATEDVLRDFYCSIVKRNRKNLMWGPMVAHLRQRRTPPPKVLLDNLDNLRQNFRNPTQHPDKVYDIQEVQDLFALSIDVVNRMVRHLHPELAAGAQQVDGAQTSQRTK